jgi:hypothetical protein
MDRECKEIAHLKTMWGQQTRRSTHLIIGEILERDNVGSFDGNKHWFFSVGYAFRNALDITYDQRQTDHVKYMVWTQGPLLRFAVGDVLHAKSESMAVAVTYAMPMGWDVEASSMYEGIVAYDIFDESEDEIKKVGKQTTSQMGFLNLLINGPERQTL